MEWYTRDVDVWGTRAHACTKARSEGRGRSRDRGIMHLDPFLWPPYNENVNAGLPVIPEVEGICDPQRDNGWFILEGRNPRQWIAPRQMYLQLGLYTKPCSNKKLGYETHLRTAMVEELAGAAWWSVCINIMCRWSNCVVFAPFWFLSFAKLEYFLHWKTTQLRGANSRPAAVRRRQKFCLGRTFDI